MPGNRCDDITRSDDGMVLSTVLFLSDVRLIIEFRSQVRSSSQCYSHATLTIDLSIISGYSL